MPRDFGDFQTPPKLVAAIFQCLEREKKDWRRALEPTCGSGSFIAGLLGSQLSPREIQGIELQETHLANARQLANASVSIKQGNLFEIDLRQELRWKGSGPLLVVGNPPWVTNSELSALRSTNLPVKTNFKGLRGFDAMTGESNFDIAEYIWLKLIRELGAEQPTIALLCKTVVARNVLKFAADTGIPITRSFIRRIDAKNWFGANVDACLFYVELGLVAQKYETPVYRDLDASVPDTVIGVLDGNLIADVNTYACMSLSKTRELLLIWRQGLKHDAASVMELTYTASGELSNKLGEIVTVEPEYVYPLLKSSDLFNGVTGRKAVIVTQKSLGDDTARLERDAPMLWDYLNAHAEYFDQRKSSIYKDQPKFGIFGIGNYSFAFYKVGISGMYKTPRFQVISPLNGQAVMLDDTCYFAACDSREHAESLASLLNSPAYLSAINSMAFYDSKRPITKKLLQRLNAVSERIQHPLLFEGS